MPPQGDFTPPFFARQGQDKPRRPPSGGAGLDSQSPPAFFVVKGAYPQSWLAPVFSLLETSLFITATAGIIGKRANVHVFLLHRKCVSP